MQNLKGGCTVSNWQLVIGQIRENLLNESSVIPAAFGENAL